MQIAPCPLPLSISLAFVLAFVTPFGSPIQLVLSVHPMHCSLSLFVLLQSFLNEIILFLR